MMAICEGFNTSVDTFNCTIQIEIAVGFKKRLKKHTQENMNAGAGPNASMKYAHSAPDDVFIVPNSAQANAPVDEEKREY